MIFIKQLEELKQKLDKKIDKELEELIADLKQCRPKVIIERAYEKVSKEKIAYKIKEKNYDFIELKALLKSKNILDECYDEWLKIDGNFNEILSYAVDNRIKLIVEELKKEKTKNKESR